MNYLHQDNQSLKFVDWRLPEHRIEGFFRWLEWRLKWSDLDHYKVNNTYRDHAGMSKEQQYWFATIFGTTYQSEMAWVIFSQFPEFSKIDIEKVSKWNDENYTRQLYARDTKYNKGRIAEQFESIKKVVAPYGSLTNYYESKLVADTHQSYENVFNAVMSFQKFGRMTSWITCQVLQETGDLPILPKNVLATDPSSWSVRSGLLYLFGEDNMIEAKDKNLKLTSDDYAKVGKYEETLVSLCRERITPKFSFMTNFLLESHLCQYKKLMLGGDYAGHSSGDHQKRADYLAANWPEVDFKCFYKMVDTAYYPLVRGLPENKVLRDLTMKTGQMINMHTDFNDMPDMHKELGITISDLKSVEPEYLKRLDAKITDYASKLSDTKVLTGVEAFL